MDKSVLRSLILLTFTMLMACQGGNSNPPSSKAFPKETAKQTETVRDITLYLYHDFPEHKAKMLADIWKRYIFLTIKFRQRVIPYLYYARENTSRGESRTITNSVVLLM